MSRAWIDWRRTELQRNPAIGRAQIPFDVLSVGLLHYLADPCGQSLLREPTAFLDGGTSHIGQIRRRAVAFGGVSDHPQYARPEEAPDEVPVSASKIVRFKW